MNINTTLGILSAIAFILPPLIIVFSRLFTISLLALFIYFISVFLYNLMSENIFVVSLDVKRKIGVVNNYLDVPLMLTYMLLFCADKWKKNIILTMLAIFTVYEVIIFYHYQLSSLSSKYIMGPGILIVLIASIYFFITNIKFTIVQGKGIGKTLMASSILFAYGCYSLVYIFAFIIKTPNRGDVFTIYYLSSIIFSGLMTAGLIWLKKRLKDIREVQVTRKELSLFFNS